MVNGLRLLREKKLITQQELADASGVGVATVSRLEAGKVRPSIRTIRSLAKVLGVTPVELRDRILSIQYPLM